MSIWKELLQKHRNEKILLVEDELTKTRSVSRTAQNFGVARQQLYQFCKTNNIEIPNPSAIEVLIENGGNDESQG